MGTMDSNTPQPGLNDRRFSRRAALRLGGLVVGLLPVIVLLAFSLIQPGYTDALFYDPTGQMILKAAIGMDFMALMSIRYMLKVDY